MPLGSANSVPDKPKRPAKPPTPSIKVVGHFGAKMTVEQLPPAGKSTRLANYFTVTNPKNAEFLQKTNGPYQLRYLHNPTEPPCRQDLTAKSLAAIGKYYKYDNHRRAASQCSSYDTRSQGSNYDQ